METGRVVGRMSVGGRTITQFATQITQAPACCVPGIVKWSQRVQASAASDTERGGGTGGSESKREGWMCRVGGGKVCHIRQHLAPRAGPLKSDITQRVKINGWSFRPKKKKRGGRKIWMAYAKWRITCREAVFTTPKSVATGHTSTQGPPQNSLMVRIVNGEVLLVAGGRSDVPNQSTKTEGKNNGGLALPQQHHVQYTRCRPPNGAQASRSWRLDQETSAPCFLGNEEE
jgi:hypothetical protein